MKLVSVLLPADKPEKLRLARAIDLRAPIDTVLGWRVLVRGPAVILLPPPDSADPGGFEFARSACTLRWDSTVPADYDKITTYTSEPLTRRVAGEPTDEELERATAPAKAAAR